jgi:hypothetical protein
LLRCREKALVVGDMIDVASNAGLKGAQDINEGLLLFGDTRQAVHEHRHLGIGIVLAELFDEGFEVSDAIILALASNALGLAVLFPLLQTSGGSLVRRRVGIDRVGGLHRRHVG